MLFKALVSLTALAAGASAQLDSSVQASVASVLLTAIPPESLQLALTNSASFSAELASSLSAGNTPEWYQALPSDVKTLLPQLYPASTPALTTALETTTPAATPSPTGAVSGSSSAPLNSTVISTVVSPTLGTTGGANSESTTGSTGGAPAYPTAVVGAGLAGALGFLGMLAL
ncbi:hypothetical protein BU26DRAFT_512568 [Trematosphaeria pertusa]|uniref:FAS1 domain-containing protein n=1 Tax=Trematosphaeria pertusa TaxID=390896 RepID=A0A6A6J0C5_9PLEO|nr:uncharacterized protein BU26DRAFT_512568 [Trematosphaeria pertusa]KAF2255602.1 hypothetical protein BU26DRAFT_512568 [Trematosphaeria pertusa]